MFGQIPLLFILDVHTTYRKERRSHQKKRIKSGHLSIWAGHILLSQVIPRTLPFVPFVTTVCPDQMLFQKVNSTTALSLQEASEDLRCNMKGEIDGGWMIFPSIWHLVDGRLDCQHLHPAHSSMRAPEGDKCDKCTFWTPGPMRIACQKHLIHASHSIA